MKHSPMEFTPEKPDTQQRIQSWTAPKGPSILGTKTHPKYGICDLGLYSLLFGHVDPQGKADDEGK